MQAESLEGLLADELEGLLSIERQATRLLPRLSKLVSTKELAEAIHEHTTGTRQYAADLKPVLKQLGRGGNYAVEAAAEAMLEACAVVEQRFAKGTLRDAALLAALQRLEHYRSAVYASTLALATQLGEDKILDLLKQGALQNDLTAKRFAQIAVQVNAEAFIDTHSEENAPTITSA